MAEGTHSRKHYITIWVWLVGLLLVSVAGPFIGSALGMLWVTLLTAFGIALVKAYLVARNFMHINAEKRYIRYLLGTALVFMLLLFAGVSPDVLKHKGLRWENVASNEHSKEELAKQAQGSDAHGHH